MPVAAYTLRIRDEAGDDTRWQETRVVAASLAQALVKAQQRFGVERVMAVAQDVVGEPLTEAEHAEAREAPVVPEPIPDPQIVHAHDATFDPDSRADAIVAAVVEAGPPPPPRAPMPWEGRWRPSNLIWLGIAAGLVAFFFWYQLGGPPRDRFVTAEPATAHANPGLALGDAAPRGGVLAASGVRLRRGEDTAAMAEMVGESMAAVSGEDEVDPSAQDGDDGLDDDVRTIGTLVGDMFSRWPDEEADAPADAPPYRVAQPDDVVGAPMPALPEPPPTIASREASVLRPFFVGVDRGGGIIETLRVPAYDADHARAIVADLPERPIIVRGPSPQLDW
jgi:hypothetical protein